MQSNALKNMVILGAMALFLAVGVVPAQAIPIEVHFTATNFILNYTSPPPTDPVTGTIIYEAASIYDLPGPEDTGKINSLISINLTLDTHTYSISEVGFLNLDSWSFRMIGGTLNLVNAISSGTNDFTISWYKNTLAPRSFDYASSSNPSNIWDSVTFSNFTVTESTSPVPEPTTMLLFGSGLLGFLGLRRKFKK